ncbi:hypothetical protein GQ600_21962 [Phytophthora cactorum]|nr:hypothetical protein GQ600_21962 [Phytophthora cactorum]
MGRSHYSDSSHCGKEQHVPDQVGVKIWVDPDHPRGITCTPARVAEKGPRHERRVQCVNRSFRPGDDHVWTSVEKPDGVNGAMELYSHNMTSTQCDDDGTCYFYTNRSTS